MSFSVQDPLTLFSQWLEEAAATEVNDPNAMALATADSDGTLSNRIVLLKGHDHHGFRFFTNYEGRKGKALEANPRAAALFHWKTLDRQVRLEGPVSRLSTEESQAYYDTRARGSRIGAWASLQSQPLPERAALEDRIAAFEAKFEGQEQFSKPDYWGGFIIQPLAMEFWRAGDFRLHERVRLTRSHPGAAWGESPLYP
ncbi:MAG: pyridoxamine 5'-phosphate oxidase [Rhodospirillaceae bacterium TMED140]|nr:pyridoxamine 5'-phosphate oxidase [Rhodospirillaceae bacterium]OUX70898.1 MAG: pyridoxamine 5'-phosphate oxidase [Rhodospirillaceae bacterium TMED140]